MAVSERVKPPTPAQEVAFVGLFEQLPPEIIDDVIVNDGMRQRISDPRLLFWFNPDNLIRRAAVFAIGSQMGLPRLQAPTMHRAATLKHTPAHPFVDEHDRCFSQIVVKGNGFTGRSLASNSLSIKRLGNRDPLGLFGLKDAQADMEVSNKLAMYGARVSRGIAILPINHNELRKWWYGNFPQAGFEYDLSEFLDIVEGNSDQAVLYVRAIGADRLEDEQGGFYRSKLQVQAARVISAEAQLTGIEKFLSFYGLDTLNMVGINMSSSIDDLGALAAWDGKSFIDRPLISGMVLLRFFQIYFHNWNFGVRRVFSDREFNGRFGVKVITPQNFCLNGSWCDFETIANGLSPDSTSQRSDFSPFYAAYLVTPDQNELRLGSFAKERGENKAREILEVSQ